MDWNEIMNEVLPWLIRIAITAIGGFITYLINKHIKDETLKRISLSITETIQNAALSTQQTYVDALKKEGKFDKEAQAKALELALNEAKTNLPEETKKWLNNNYTDVDAYLRSRLEAVIGFFKK